MSIIVQNLAKTFGEQKAVNQISFEVPSGTIVGFLGPNGAGKSTTMKMLTTYIPPTSGTASIYGLDIIEQAMEVRKIVGYLPESNPLYYDLYVREYLEIVAGIYNLGAQSKQRIEAVIEMTGLQKEIKKKIGNLSKGYKQRVGLAQALIHDPKVLILDEPTSGLDPNQLVDIRDLIINIGKEKTILLSTHIMQEVEAMCQNVIIINNGNIVANDHIESLQQNTQQSDIHSIMIEFEHPIDIASIKLPIASEIIAQDEKIIEIQTTQLAEIRKYMLQWSMDNNNDIVNINTNQRNLEATFRALTK